jgi:hypothetical protein
MSNDLESVPLNPSPESGEKSPPWVKVGFVAAASALAGGLAAAWWYKKTLSKLQEAEGTTNRPPIEILGDESEAE